MAAFEAWVSGRVQGVGFRAWTRHRGRELGLQGTVTNLLDGRVHVVAEGPQAACDALLAVLRTDGPGRVDEVVARWVAGRGMRGFEVGFSR